MLETAERVDKLEQVLAQFITNVGIEFNKAYNMRIRSEAEFLEFKDEMLEFKDEMRLHKKEMDTKWGELANKMGTLVEDLVAPSIPRVVKAVYGREVVDLMIRRTRKLPDGSMREYDAIAVTEGVVYLNSTKSTLRTADADKFVEEIQAFRNMFPEYGAYKLVGILASLRADEGVITYAEKKGFIVLSTGDGLMQVMNSKGFQPREWA